MITSGSMQDIAGSAFFSEAYLGSTQAGGR
jgi:hypothetical protein